jgi:hypothetical protein
VTFLEDDIQANLGTYEGYALTEGYAVVRAVVGYGTRSQVCGTPDVVPGNGVFVPAGDPATDGEYQDPERPMAEKDVVMVIQYIREQVATDPLWSQLDDTRIVLMGHSIHAIVSSWTGLGPDRASVTFPTPANSQETRATGVWGFIDRRGLLYLPGIEQGALGLHWPGAGSCAPALTLDQGAPSIAAITPSSVPQNASAIHYAVPGQVPFVFMYYCDDNDTPVPPTLPPVLPYADDDEPEHSAWDGLFWKALYPYESKIVVDSGVADGIKSGGWYDQVVEPTTNLAGTETGGTETPEEVEIAFDWFEELAVHGSPTFTNLGAGTVLSTGGTDYLPHTTARYNLATNKVTLFYAGAPPTAGDETWTVRVVENGVVQSSPALDTTSTGIGAIAFFSSASGVRPYQLEFTLQGTGIQTRSNVLELDPH